jgi:imidazolonepropionase-like amidohydrolase
LPQDFKIMSFRISTLLLAYAATVFAWSAHADDLEAQKILFTNVHVFDGVSETRVEDANVLVVGNLIAEVSTEPLTVDNAQVIDGGGRTLMPGLMDAHVHLALVRRPGEVLNDYDWMYVGALANEQAKEMLLRGFTTVRDIGGPTVGLHRAIEEGYVVGPRLFSSGPYITQTSGHGDFRNYNQLHPRIYGQFSLMEMQGWLIMADSPAQVTQAVREALRFGAKQIKMMAGGGVSSPYDPLHTVQGGPEEFTAAVKAAEQWGTYVAVHAYTDEAVRQAVEAGVMCIEHGPFLTEDTMKLMAEKGVFLAPTARISLTSPDDVGLDPNSGTAAKLRQVNEGASNQLRWAKEYGVTLVFSTDQFGTPENFKEQSNEFLTLAEVFEPFDVLKMATSNVAALLDLSGELHPYREGALGVIEAGAYADILLVEGNPLEDVTLLAEYEDKIDFIMKNGVIYKHTLEQ